MLELFKENIDKIKKTAGITLAVLVLSIASIIIFNTIKLSGDFDLSYTGKAMKHLINDHKANDINFSFIKISFDPKNYFEKKSDSEMNIAAAIGLFLISSMIIFYYFPERKLSYAESFLIAVGFKDSFYRPPKHLP